VADVAPKLYSVPFLFVLGYLLVDFGRPHSWVPILGYLRPGIWVLGGGMLGGSIIYGDTSKAAFFNDLARSVKGAQGLMQLMPDTADRFGVRDAWNPDDNVRGGAGYLRYLLDLFQGDVRLALAAYNAGENVVLNLKRIPPYAETRTYVAKIMKRFGTGRDPYLPDTSEAEAPPENVAEQPTH